MAANTITIDVVIGVVRERVADVTQAIAVDIFLTAVAGVRTVIDVATNTVTIDVIIGVIRERIADIAVAIAIRIGLVVVGDAWAVVEGVDDTVHVGVGNRMLDHDVVDTGFYEGSTAGITCCHHDAHGLACQ